MFYSELFECIPLKVEGEWLVVKQNKTLSSLRGWFNYASLEEGKLIDYLLRLDNPARQLYLDDFVNRLLEAFNQLSEAYKETDCADVVEIFLAVRWALGSLVFRFRGLGLACNTEVVNRWGNKFPFVKDFPLLALASTDDPKGNVFKLPIELDTKRANKYIGKAIEVGLIEMDGDRLKWTITKRGGKVRLAYFLFRVYCQDDADKDNGSPFPETALNILFGESRLGHSLSQIANNKSMKYGDIDKLFK